MYLDQEPQSYLNSDGVVDSVLPVEDGAGVPLWVDIILDCGAFHFVGLTDKVDIRVGSCNTAGITSSSMCLSSLLVIATPASIYSELC